MLISFLTNVENLQKLQFVVASTDSDAVIFVTCELLSKIIQQTRLEMVMSAPSDMLENQPSPNASTITHFTQIYELFIKILLEKYMKIKSFTVNSIANLLGCILKKIWPEVKDNQLFVENIKPFFFTQVKILFWINSFKISFLEQSLSRKYWTQSLRTNYFKYQLL